MVKVDNGYNKDAQKLDNFFNDVEIMIAVDWFLHMFL